MSEIKNYSHIVNKQFKVNRKRNISTISGIILSIILFTIVGYIQNYYKEMDILEAKNRKGNYEAVLTNLSMKDIDRLNNNILVDQVGLYTEMYNSTIGVGDKEKYIKVYSVDRVALEELFYPIMELTRGKLPQRNNEILIDSVAKYSLDKDVGDTLKLGKTEYKIVGTYDKIESPEPYTIEIITYFNKEKNLKNVNAAFNVTHKNDKYKTIRKVADDLGVTNDNDEGKKLLLNRLIFYNYESSDATTSNVFNDKKLVEIILYIAILVLTIFMTYGSINVSIKERVEQFSILRCMGATPSKIRNLLIRESFLLAAFSIIPGVVLGQITCFFISSVILKKIFTLATPYRIYPNVIGIVVFLSVINIVISTIIPIIKVGKIPPIEGLNNGGEIKNTGRNKMPKIIKKIFGYNALLAYKNIRGNNRTFLITTITSVIMLSTFIVFSGYSSNLIRQYNEEQNTSKDVTLNINIKYKDKDIFKEMDKYKKEVKDLGVTSDIFGRAEYFFSGVFENVDFNKWIRSEDNHDTLGQQSVNINGKPSVYSEIINIMILEDNALKEVLSSAGNNKITLEDFKENGVLISDRMIAKKFGEMKREPLFNLNENEIFTARIDNGNYDESNKTIEEKCRDILKNSNDIKFKYLGSVNTKKAIDGYGFGNITNLIVSKDFYNNNKELFIKNKEISRGISESIKLTLTLKPNINRDVALKTIENYANQIEGDYIDNQLNNVQLESGVLVTSSMVYLITFLTMIVGGINLINNKNISIKLRNKEIGTLLALGINKKRLKKILMLEGLMQWFISTGISLILSYTILIILYKIMIYTELVSRTKLPILATIFGVGALFIINVLGSYLPIRRLEYTNTSQLIRNQE